MQVPAADSIARNRRPLTPGRVLASVMLALAAAVPTVAARATRPSRSNPEPGMEGFMDL